MLSILFLLYYLINFNLCSSVLTNNFYQNHKLISVQMPKDYELLNLNQEDCENKLKEFNSKLKFYQLDLFDCKSLKNDNLFKTLIYLLLDQAPINIWQLKINHSIFTVSPDYQIPVEDFLLNNSLNYQILNDNIQANLNNEILNNYNNLFNLNSINSQTSFNFDVYHNLVEIYNYLKFVEKEFPDIVKIKSIGKTFEGRDILSVTIEKKDGNKKPTIFLNAGLHAREWITQASSLVLINKLINIFNSVKNSTEFSLSNTINTKEIEILNNIKWVIIPVANPDGYAYTWIQDRLWIKNRSVPKAKPHRAPWNIFNQCVGVDLNKNFDYYFATFAHSTNPCQDMFPGDEAFSEQETKAIRKLALDLKPSAYINLHSYSQTIMFPNTIIRGKIDNHEILKKVASKMANAMFKIDNKKYTVGPISRFHYSIAGDSISWMNLKAGVNLTYIIELRDTGLYGYNLPINNISPSGEELFQAVLTLSKEL